MRCGRGFIKAEASGRLPRRVGLFVLGIVLAGCAPERSANTDPLLGGAPLPRGGPVAAPPPTVAVAPPLPPLSGPPPLPPPSGALSPAALASSSSTPDANPLRLGPPSAPVTGPPQANVLASTPHDAADPWRSAPPVPVGATLKGPESETSTRPMAMIAPPTIGAAGASAAASPVGRDSYADLQEKLAQRKVMFQALEAADEQGVWRFSCGVPSRDQPGAVHRFEVSAVGDNGLNAIRTGIEQIDIYRK